MLKQIYLNQEEVAIKDSIENVYSAFRTGGYDAKGQFLEIKDALSTQDSHLAFARAITEIVQETIEPNLIGTYLLNQIYTTDRGTTQVTIRTLGPLGAVNLDIAEDGEYPEVGVGRNQSSLVTANYTKCGLKVKITEEMIQASQWNMIEYWIKEATKALARWKETKIFNLLTSVGNLVFDNANPSAAEIGRTLGRDINGVGNGSMTHSDLIDLYSSLLTKGYLPNVILVHPLHWAMFAKDPIIREAGLVKGDIREWLTSQISPVNPYAKIKPWTQATRLGNFWSEELNLSETALLANSKPVIPSYSPLSGITVIPSHYMTIDTTANTASIIMLDTNNAGAVIINEEITLDSWDEKERDLKVIKLREKYAIVLFDNGRAVAVARNISLEPNETFTNPQVILENLAPISRK